MIPAPPEGWPEFVARSWGKAAIHRQGVFDRRFVDLARMHRIFVRAGADGSSIDHRVRVYLNHGRQQHPSKWLPTRADHDLPAYGARLRKKTGADFTVLLNGTSAYDAVLHARACAFLRALGRHAPVSIEHDIALYVSDARETTFGIHRDEVNNFIFMVHGRKRFRVWPHDRKTPDTFDLAAGDLLYIPTGMNHIAESKRGLCAHVLDHARGQSRRRRRIRGTDRDAPHQRKAGGPHEPARGRRSRIPGAIAAFARPRARALSSDHPGAGSEVRAAWRLRSSSFGFVLGPPTREIALKDGDRIAYAKTSGLMAYPDGLIIANGHAYRMPPLPKIRRMLDELKVSEPRPVAHWLRRGASARADADFVRAVLEAVAGMHAIEIVR